jgi:hypothetical protein
MEEKNKQLLITDLCARLPYGVWVECCGVSGKLDNVWITHFYNGGNAVVDVNGNTDFFHDSDYFDITKIKPYLRPMSSMTDEEDIRRCAFLDDIEGGIEDAIPNYIDWLNAHHFDYRDLIKRGLAIEAPEGMYNF